MGRISCQLLAAALVCIAASSGPAGAQDGADAAGQANNPLANMTALNFQNYYIGDLTDVDEDANQFWVRFAKPFSVKETNWILRASLPVNSFPVPSGQDDGTSGGQFPRPGGINPALADFDTETGLGDLNVFAAYLFDTGNPAVSFGLGPQLTAPTASEDALGSEKWSVGLMNVLFNGSSPRFQYGYLLSYQASFAGEDDRQNVSVGAFQPFAFYQLGAGRYLRGAPIWVYNFENDNYSVPLGVGLGQVIKKGKTVYNVFVEPQFSVADDGPGQPEWQIFFGLNLQFLN